MNMRSSTPRLIALWVIAGALTFVLSCSSVSPPAPGQQTPGDNLSQGTAQPKYGGVLPLAQAVGDPPSFDAHQEATLDVVGPTSPTYDRLLQYDIQDETKVVPDLAERWEWIADGKALTFFLHKGVKFHNGNPFTAEDVKFTLDRLRVPPKGVSSLRQSLFDPVQDVIVVDPATVKVTVKRPYPALLFVLAGGFMQIYDKEFVEEKGQDIMKKEVMGTGPFKFTEYIRGVSIEVVKNPDYWKQGKPYLDGIKYYVIPDEGTRVAALRAGQILICGGCGAQNVDKVVQEMGGKVQLQTKGGGGIPHLTLNTAKPPFDNVKVRQAINYAINRTDLSKITLSNVRGTFPDPWGLPPEELAKMPGYNTDQAANVAKAKQLLAEAGFPDGFATSIETRQGKSYEDVGIFVQDALKSIGVTVKLNLLETSAYFDVSAKGPFNMLYTSPATTFKDPDAYYAELWICDSVRNYARYCDAELDALYLKQSSTLDVAERKRLVNELERKMLTVSYKVMVGQNVGRDLIWNSVQNYYAHGVTHNNKKMTEVWLDK